MAPRYINVYLDGDYYKNNYKNIFATYIHPIVDTLEGYEYKCTTQLNMTEAEYKFLNERNAKHAVRILNKQFKTLPSFLFEGKKIATLMPTNYEKMGARNIIRPDYHSVNQSVKLISGFSKLKLNKKYIERDSPPLPANDYCGKEMKGSDGKIYSSVKNNKGICQWKKL